MILLGGKMLPSGVVNMDHLAKAQSHQLVDASIKCQQGLECQFLVAYATLLLPLGQMPRA
jgi:hypothetical protein